MQGFKPIKLSNRGKEINTNDTNQIIPQWFCRFETINGDCNDQKIEELMTMISNHYHWVQIEKLFSFHK